MKLVDLRMDEQRITQVQFHDISSLSFSIPSGDSISTTRAGKGVFSAMKLGKIKSYRDDHKKGGKTTHITQNNACLTPNEHN